MTATHAIINDNAKATAKDKDLVLWSMNNPDYYGEEFFRIGFDAVREGLLTDYKVLVLTISEDDIPDRSRGCRAISNKRNKDGRRQ